MAAIRKEDVQEIVAEIRDMLQLRADPAEAELQRLYKKYVSVVQTANSVLKRCLDLIEKGRKSDAIMRSEENNLLELVSILDFPEQHEWIAYVSQFGLSVPPAIDQFASRQINACYAPAQRLEPLYRLNRRHVLANSPLRVRIGVMRRIEKMEEGSAREVAGRHLELFETERIKGVRKELADATGEQNLRQLNLLCAELNSKDWFKSPEQALIRSAAKAVKHEESRRARLRMPDLAARLQDAWSAQDVTDARRIREQWEASQKLAQRPETDSLIQETSAAFAWLKEIDDEESRQRQHEDAVTQLRDALDQRKAREFLEPLEHTLEITEVGIPATLKARLKSRYDELDTESSRKNLRRLVATSLSIICIAAVGIFVLQKRSIHDRTEGHISALTTLLERNDVDAAELYVATLQKEQPDMADVPEVQMLIVDVSQAREDEGVRKAAFEGHVLSVKEKLNQATFLTEVKTFKDQANSLNAKGGAEDNEVEQLITSIEQKQQEIQTQIDHRFETALQEAAGEFETYKKQDTPDAKSLQEFLTTFRGLAQESEVSSELISVQAGPKALAMQCETLLFDLNVETQKMRLLQSVMESVGSVPAYRTALDSYVKQFPKDPLALRFESLLQTEADGWARVDEINKFVTSHSVNCTKLNPAQAMTFVSEARAFIAAYPEFPRATDLKKLTDYLTFVSRRMSEDGQPIHNGIVDLLMKANLDDLYVVMLATGERSYSNKEPEFVTEPPRVKLFPLTDWLAAARQRDERPKYFPYATVSVQMREGKPFWEAPESVLIRSIVGELRTIDEHDWERTMIDQLQRVYDQTRLDPVFRMFMLRTILATATTGSEVISDEYLKTEQQLNDMRLDGINPFDPDDETTNLVRKRVADILKPFKDPVILLPRLTASREAMSKMNIQGTYRWIAWLKHGAAGWECRSEVLTAERMTGTLHIYPRSSPGSYQLRKIGTASQGKVEILPESAQLSEGQPVYLLEE